MKTAGEVEGVLAVAGNRLFMEGLNNSSNMKRQGSHRNRKGVIIINLVVLDWNLRYGVHSWFST